MQMTSALAYCVSCLETCDQGTLIEQSLSKETLMLKSRHTIVCRAAQEAGAPHREYIDRKKGNVIFTLLYLGDSLSA